MDSTGITGIAYNRLKAHLGMAGGRTRILDPIQQVALVEDSVLERIGADVKPVAQEPTTWRPDQLPDGSPCELPALWRPVRQPDGSQAVSDDEGIIRAVMPAGSTKPATTPSWVISPCTCLRPASFCGDLNNS